ncbi:RGCVC family protein [Actinocrispum sp. NPDC049592]|uniref:RGCVC family protein n=1 Tax=Actinocrispum sp. NPDC049592 TaxID=3154835 RepID=UPI003432ED85
MASRATSSQKQDTAHDNTVRPGKRRAPPAAAFRTKPVAEDRIHTTCANCPHPWPSHDQIAVRYRTATATVTDRRGRSCVRTMKEI